MSIPTSTICQHTMEIEVLVQKIHAIASVIEGVVVLGHLLYYTATYLIAKCAIVVLQFFDNDEKAQKTAIPSVLLLYIDLIVSGYQDIKGTALV